MGGIIGFLGVLPLLFSTGAVAPQPELPEAQKIVNWPAPPYWMPPSERAPDEARTESVITASAPLPFIALTPCRLVDTRGTVGVPINTGGKFSANEIRTWAFTGLCGLPISAAAVSLNITVTGTDSNPFGFVSVWPGGTAEPNVSTLNWSTGGVTESNAAIVPLGTSPAGSVALQTGNAGANVIVDVNGYYDGSSALQLGLSRRAALDQFWTPQNALSLGMTTVGQLPELCRSDGADVWVAGSSANTVQRVRASDGKLLASWTAATGAHGVLVAMGKVFVTGISSPGALFSIDPTQTAGAVTAVASNLGNATFAAAFDGSLIWTANQSGSVSIVTPGATTPWSVTTVSTGFAALWGILYDGSNIWVTDNTTGKLFKLDGAGAILQTVTVGVHPGFPIFDGTNIWVPNGTSNSVSVVRASTGDVVATLTGNGLNDAKAAAFDGTRVLVSNALGNSVSLWRASDFTPLGSFGTGTNSNPWGACSDGVNFWVTLQSSAGQVAKF